MRRRPLGRHHSHYFGMDLPLLPDRVFWAPPEFPLQLTDVTDQTGPDAVRREDEES